MNLQLAVTFFTSSLENPTIPSFDQSSPSQAGLVFGGNEDPIGVELLKVAAREDSNGALRIDGRTIDADVDSSLLIEGAEFFVTRGGKMIARGNIENVGT